MSMIKLGWPRIDDHMREVIEGASLALTIRIFGTFLGFAVSMMIARQLGAKGSGIYFLALSVATIASTVGRLGFDNTMVRFIASHALHNEWLDVRFVYRVAIITVSVSSLLISVFLFLSAEWIASSLFGKPFAEMPLRLAALAALPQALAMIHADSLRGLKKIVASQWIKTVYVSLGTILLLYPLIQLWGANGAMAAYLGAVVFTSILAYFFWRRALRSREALLTNNTEKKLTLTPLFQSSWPLFGVALTGLIMQQAATVFLGVWGTVEDVGIFTIANRITSLLVFPLLAMISIIAPKFAEMHRQGNVAEVQKLARDSSRLLLLFIFPVAIVMALSAQWILGLFGTEFTGGAVVLNILLVGVVINAATGTVGEILLMSGNESEVRRVLIVSALVVVFLCVCLMPHFGVIGAAIAVMIGTSIQNCFMVIAVKKSLGFWPVSLKII